MKPCRMSADHIHNLRSVVTAAARIAGASILLIGSYLLLKRVFFAVITGQGTAMLETWTGIGEEHSFYRGMAMILIGAVMLALSRRVSRWIVPVPDEGCPCCRYAPPEGVSDRCAECGYRYREAATCHDAPGGTSRAEGRQQ